MRSQVGSRLVAPATRSRGWLAIATLVLAPVPANLADSGRYVVVSAIALPTELDPVGDIRAAGDGSVFVAAAKKGTWEIFLDGQRPARQVVPGNGEAGGFWVHVQIAPSPRALVIASSFRSFTWLDRGSGRLAPPFPFESIVDVDLDADGRRVALLGARRDAEGVYSPDGAIAWIGSLDHGVTDLQPILFSKSGPGSEAMNLCHFLEVGKLRYLDDGNLLVIPGVEGGANLYAPDGRLVRTWEAADLGLEDGCGLSEEQGFKLAAEWRLRYSHWFDQHRALDDLVPLAEGPGLVVRTREVDTTRWRLRILGEDGSARSFELPVTSPSRYAHLRADRLGERLVLLLREVHDGGEKPSIEQKIFVLEERR